MLRVVTFSMLVLFGLLFVEFSDQSRIFVQFLDLGHFVLFALLIFIALNLRMMRSKHWFFQLVFTVLCCISLGFLTEYLQLQVGRNFQLSDIGYDLLGGLAGYFLERIRLEIACVREKNKGWTQSLAIVVFCSIAVLGLFSFSSRHIITTLIDERNIVQEFPILSDFESPFELQRWKTASVNLTLSNYYRRGNYSLKADYLPGENPHIYLKHFHHDWSGYNVLRFSLFNTHKKSIEMIAKVYDDEHLANAFVPQDRFKRKITLNPGWNDYIISLKDISKAPSGRVMDLSRVRVLMLFMNHLKQPTTIYLDDFHLSKESIDNDSG